MYVVLTKSDDWEPWIAQVEVKASGYGEVWEYIDPDREGTVVQPLKKPSKATYWDYVPTPAISAESIANTMTTGISESSAESQPTRILPETTMSLDQQFLYEIAHNEYKDALTEYQIFTEGLSEVRLLIAGTTGPAAKPYLEDLGDKNKMP
jgi:hypothetical protein